jgi:hypothetical protein
MIDHYLDNVIQTIDGTPVRAWTPNMYVSRNFLYALWYFSHGPRTNTARTVNILRSSVMAYIGEGYARQVHDLLNGGPLGEYIREIEQGGQQYYTIKTEDLGRIEQVLDKYYAVSRQALPLLNVSSHQLTQHMLNDDGAVVGVLRNAFVRLFTDGLQRHAEVTPAGENFFSIRCQAQWQCIVAVFPARTALSLERMYILCGTVNKVRSQFVETYACEIDALPVLLFAPPGADYDAFRAANDNPYTYHLTPLGTQRFFTKMQTEILDKGYSTADIAESFPAIFPFSNGPQSPLSELRAIERLYAAIAQKKSSS